MKKAILYRLILIVVAYVLLEISSAILYSIMHGKLFSFEAIHAAQDRIIKTHLDPIVALELNPSSGRTLHPYLGFTLTPSAQVNEYGFPGSENPFSSDPNELVLAITGGSVAARFFDEAGEYLRETLEQSPQLSKRPIRIISLGISGYKQPQQLLSVSYFLALGGRLDAVVNLDGYNEIQAERNVKLDVFLAYPTRWRILTSGVRSLDAMKAIGAITLLRSIRSDAAQVARRMRRSITACVAWSGVDAGLEAAIAGRQDALAARENRPNENSEYFQSGPPNSTAAAT
jgi:hypothetical protein